MRPVNCDAETGRMRVVSAVPACLILWPAESPWQSLLARGRLMSW